MKPDATKFANINVLMAEDYIINQELATEMLKILGCTVDVAADGQEAIDKYENGSFDCILLDIQMPKVDGYQVAKHIRDKEHGTKEHIPVIALTANALESDKEKCLKAGMDAFLRKPLRLAKLEEALAAFFEKQE